MKSLLVDIELISVFVDFSREAILDLWLERWRLWLVLDDVSLSNWACCRVRVASNEVKNRLCFFRVSFCCVMIRLWWFTCSHMVLMPCRIRFWLASILSACEMGRVVEGGVWGLGVVCFGLCFGFGLLRGDCCNYH